MTLLVILGDQPDPKIGKVHYGATTAPGPPTSAEPVFDRYKAVAGAWVPITRTKAINGVWS